MIQLLINRHNEPEALIGQLLDSIAAQQGAPEFSAIIGDDGSDAPLADEFLARYPFARYEYLPHRGMCATRNALLDMADDEYVAFLDADDLYVSLIGLHVIGRHLPFDVFASKFLEERRDGDRLLGYVARDNDPFFLHGKAFRREYLVGNGIRWDDSLERSGDVVFLWQAICLTDRLVYCDTPFYLWKWNPDSICRSEPDHFVVRYGDTIRESDLLVGKFLDRGREDLASRFATLMAYDAYFMFHTQAWRRSGSKDTANLFAEALGRHRGLVVESPELYAEKQANFRWEGPSEGLAGVTPWISSVVGLGGLD